MRRHDDAPAPTDLSFVFMVPCLNEELVLGRTIDRLLAIESDHRFAVMVIDDGSTDGTRELVAGLASRWDVAAVLHQRNLGKGSAVPAGSSRCSPRG